MRRSANLLLSLPARVRTTVALALALCAFVSAAGLRAAQSSGGGSDAPTRSVWDGVFTDAQAQRGRLFYQEHCAECHGANLQGGQSRPLQGDRFWAAWQETTVGYMLGQVSRNMPHSEDGSLKGTLGTRTYVDIVAHILATNQFPAGASELTEASSAAIRIVRKDGPGELPEGSFVHVVGCLARGADRTWRLTSGSRPVRVLTGQDVDVEAALGDREYTLMFVLTSLDKFVGHRMSVRASLMGEGGSKGLNVSNVQSVSSTCE